MADIYQIPEGNNGGIPFSIPLGGNGGMFGNGNTNLMDLLGFAIIASMFGWNNGNGFGFGNNGGSGNAAFLSNQISNDAGRQLIMEAITNQGEASRTAISNLSTMLGQDFNTVNAAVQNVQNALNTIAANQGMNALQVINAIQSGNAAITSQFQQCCCQNQLALANMNTGIQQGFAGVQQSLANKSAADQLAMCQQTNALTNSASANTQAILAKLAAMETQNLQDKLDAARNENTKLSGEISQANQNNVIAGMIANAVNPLTVQLNGIKSEVDAIKRCQPETITLPNNSQTVVPTIWANGVADLVVDRIAAALNPTPTSTTGS